MSEATPRFYVFHGEDEFSRSHTLADFRRRLGAQDAVDLNTTVLDGRELTLSELRHACDAIPFLAERRLVIVAGLLSRLMPKKGGHLGEARQRLLDDLVDYLPDLPPTTRLVMIEDRAVPSRHPIIQLAREDEHGYVKRFEPPADGALPRWIMKRARHHGGEIEPRAAHRLATLIETDLRLLDQEISKLVIHSGEEGPVTQSDVEALVPYSQDPVIFDLVDALGRRDGRTAAKTLHHLLADGEHPLGLLGMISRQFRLLIQVKALKADGRAPKEIASTLGIHPFPAGKLYSQANHFTPDQLEKIYRHLSGTDLEIKTGRIDSEVALDLLVAGLATAQTR